MIDGISSIDHTDKEKTEPCQGLLIMSEKTFLTFFLHTITYLSSTL